MLFTYSNTFSDFLMNVGDCKKHYISLFKKCSFKSFAVEKLYRFWIVVRICLTILKTRDVEAFWYKIEIKVIYFVPLCSIVFDHMVYSDLKVLIIKIKTRQLRQIQKSNQCVWAHEHCYYPSVQIRTKNVLQTASAVGIKATHSIYNWRIMDSSSKSQVGVL